MRRFVRRPSPAMIVALIALVAATAGNAIADQVTAAVSALKANSVTSKSVKNGSLLVKDFKKSELKKLTGKAGKTGATGPAGAAGPQGPAGRPAHQDRGGRRVPREDRQVRGLRQARRDRLVRLRPGWRRPGRQLRHAEHEHHKRPVPQDPGAREVDGRLRRRQQPDGDVRQRLPGGPPTTGDVRRDRRHAPQCRHSGRRGIAREQRDRAQRPVDAATAEGHVLHRIQPRDGSGGQVLHRRQVPHSGAVAGLRVAPGFILNLPPIILP